MLWKCTLWELLSSAPHCIVKMVGNYNRNWPFSDGFNGNSNTKVIYKRKHLGRTLLFSHCGLTVYSCIFWMYAIFFWISACNDINFWGVFFFLWKDSNLHCANHSDNCKNKFRHPKIAVILKFEHYGFTITLIALKDVDGMANCTTW